MATKRDNGETAVLERGELPDVTGQPKIVFAGGRGKTGKSTFMRWAIERCIERGGEPVIADADRTNQTLMAFFPTAIKPPSAEDDDVRLWLNDLADNQIEGREAGRDAEHARFERRNTAFLDLGGGDLTLKHWARDLDLAPFLTHHGITPVVFYLLGSDIDDLSYLRDLETVFAPRHTCLVLNEGMVPSGRSPLSAFNPIIDHPVFESAVKRGALFLRMPKLGCMQEIDRRRLSFADAEAGRVREGQDRIGPTMRQMIAIWRRETEASFGKVSAWIS